MTMLIIVFDAENNRVMARTPFSFLDRCKAIPGARWDKNRRVWTFPATPTIARRIAETLTPKLDDMPEQVQTLLARSSQSGDGPHIEQPGLWPHQQRAAAMIVRRGSVLVAHDMGTGKTRTTIAAIQHLAESDSQFRRVLIVGPKSALHVWREQFDIYWDASVPFSLTMADRGTMKARTKSAAAKKTIAELNRAVFVLVINYEAVWRGELGEWVRRQKWDMIVCDEVHRIKSHDRKAKASPFIAKLANWRTWRVGLSGTPLPHSPLDAWAIFRFLDVGIFGSSFSRFRDRYAVMGGYRPPGATGGVEIKGWKNMDEFNRLFHSITDYVRSEDVLHLPEQIHERRIVDLSPAARRIYDDLERDMIAQIKGGVVTAANALAKLLRLQQITGGCASVRTSPRITELRRIDYAKRDALIDLIGDLSRREPLVVFCRFQADLDAVIEAAVETERRCWELSGRIKQLPEWKRDAENGVGPILATQIQAGGLGVDMSAARYCVYYSLGFNLGDYEQSLKRLHRPGQRRNVTYIHLLARDTVDGVVYRTLQARKDVVEAVLSYLGGADARVGDGATEAFG